jgi:arylsulfatase
MKTAMLSRPLLSLGAFLAFVIAVATTCPAAPATSQPSPRAGRPNIVLIMADDMGYSDASCMGGEIPTPNLDRLAKEGVTFTQFYNTSRCCPTRAALMTGLYPHQAGVGHMTWLDTNLPGYRADLSHDTPTIAEILKPAGYANYMVGKWHLTNNDTGDKPKDNWPRQRGFDRYYGTIKGSGSYYDPLMLVRENTPVSPETDTEYKSDHYYYTDAIADESSRYIREHHAARADQPFFLYAAFTSPHWPLQAPEETIAKYKGKYDGGYAPIRAARLERMKSLGLVDPRWELSPQPDEWDAQKNKAWEARCMEVYAAQIDRMDAGIGRILKSLEATDQLDNTLVVFLQDNGACDENTGRNQLHPRRGARGGVGTMPGPADTFLSYGRNWANVSNTPFRMYKHYVHEGGISTPLIVRWPAGVRRHGEFERQPGHLIDLVPTFCAVAGATYPKQFNGHDTPALPGVDLAPALAGGALERKSPIFFEHEGNRAVRDGKWKLVAKGVKGPWELYDIDADRSEMHDLAAAQPDRVKSMAAAWQAWAEQNNVLPLLPQDKVAKKKGPGAAQE